MDNQEIINRLWERDTTDPKIVDMLYSMAVNTADHKMSYIPYCLPRSQLSDGPE